MSVPKQTSIYGLASDTRRGVIKFRLPASRITARAYNACQDRKTRAFFSTILTAGSPPFPGFIAPRFTDFRLYRSYAGET